MTLKDLVGFQLVSGNERQICVKKGGETYALEIVEYEGDCCGYNDIEVELYISDEETSRNPVITAVSMEACEDSGYGSMGHLTFYGENKKIAKADAYSSSGSGWCYGACVRIVCKELDVDETLSQW